MARDFREILSGEVAGADLDEARIPSAETRPKMKKGMLYTWDQINTALTMSNKSAKEIAGILVKLNRVAKERLTVQDEMGESTTAGAGVGNYSPPLGMTRRDSQKFSTTDSMLKQFDQCTFHMGRKGMLQQCRKMGLSLGHLNDEDLRKTLKAMSVRNKRKFMGASK